MDTTPLMTKKISNRDIEEWHNERTNKDNRFSRRRAGAQNRHSHTVEFDKVLKEMIGVK